MSGSKSPNKAIRAQERRRLRNRLLRNRTRTVLKQARQTVASGDADKASPATARAVSTLDRAVTKNLYHKNKVARLKSRLVKKANALSATTSS